MSTANMMPASGPLGGPNGGSELEKSGVRVGIAVAVSLGINFLLLVAAGKIAQNMEVREPSVDEQTSITIRQIAATPKPVATPKKAVPTPRAAATPRPQATPRPVPTPRPRVRPREVATPRPIPTPVATPRPIATPAPLPTPIASASVTRESNAPRRAFARPTEVATPRRGDTATQPAVRAASAKIESGSAAPAPARVASNTTVRRATAAAAAALGSGPTAINNSPALAQPDVTSAVTTPTRQLATSGGRIARSGARNNVVTMNERAAAATVSPTDFTLPTGGTIRSGTAVARQGNANVATVSDVSGAPTVISSNQEAEVNAPITGERRLVGIRGAKIAPRGAAISSMTARSGSADFAAGVGLAGGSADGAAGATGAGRGTARGVATRGGGTAEGRGGAISAANGNGAGVEGDGIGTGSGRGQSGVSGSTGRSGRVLGSSQVGGTAGGPRTGSGAGTVVGVPDGVPGGSIHTGGANTRANGTGRANGKTDEGPSAVASKNDAKVADNVIAPEKRDTKKVKTTDSDSDVQIGGNATQIAAQVAGRPEFQTPDELLRVKISDRAIRVRVTIEPNGRHSEELLDGTGNSDLDRALLGWMKSWRWDPAKQDGKAVRSTLTRKVSVSQD